MNAVTLTRPYLRPLPGPRDGALVARHHDPRPCVTNPPQWWDTGNEHNARAIRLCRGCPLRATCKPTEDKPAGLIIAAVPYGTHGRALQVCGSCDRPRTREGDAGVPRCGCPGKPSRGERDAERDAERQARAQARLAEAALRKANTQPRIPRDELIARWLPLHEQGLNAREAAAQLGVLHSTLKGALARARHGGDPRVPATLRGNHRQTRQVAA